MPLMEDDIIVRVQSAPTVTDVENSFATLEQLDDLIKFRMDADVWSAASEDLKVRAAVSAYRDLMKLAYRSFYGRLQNRDYEFPTTVTVRDTVTWPPMEDPEFVIAIRQAQSAQVMYLMNGTQVRDMAREGIRMSRSLGADMEFTGYKGAVCAEAMEIIGRWVEIMPRMRRL